MTTAGRTIRLFLVDGTATGLMTAEIMNWTGHVLVVPRTLVSELQRRPEAPRTGVYFLIGPDPDGSEKNALYIGETDTVGKRISDHDKDERKDWWEKAILITSKDQNLTKTHVRYLEARLIALAASAGRAISTNGTAPLPQDLPESDVADMEFFLAQIQQVLPVLGAEFLRPKPQVTRRNEQSALPVPHEESPRFELYSKKHGIRAHAVIVDGEIVVTEGSLANSEWVSTVTADMGYQKLRQKLIDSGVLVEDPTTGLKRYTEDCSFKSPSAAAVVTLGRPANGRTEWRVKETGQTYAEWQEKGAELAGSGRSTHKGFFGEQP
ncbi:GIY-YIG nuclease family protein [Kordiimonas sp.]|uniref:GIY-YIG nuclease family protein n=1 Tax=Kordiimonas sp. TaxID=1970157 RepID=UPI003A9529B2